MEKAVEMGIYIFLMKLTEKGKREIKDAPQWLESVAKSFEACSGTLDHIYPVLGEYDFVAIGEAPSDQDMMCFILGLALQSNVTTTTLKAFSLKEFAGMISDLRLGKAPM